MCAIGGFNLTKLASNTKEVLMETPEEKRLKGLQNQDLVSGVIPQESTWNKLEC